MRTMTTGRWIVAIAAAVAMAGAVGAETLDLGGLMEGAERPAVVKLGEMGAGWIRMQLQGGGEVRGMVSALVGQPGNVVFTRGETVALGGETFLVAYRLSDAIDWRAVQRRMRDGQGESPVSAETEATLTYLNLRAIDGLSDVRPFDLAQEIESAKTSADGLRVMLGGAGGPFAWRPGGDRGGTQRGGRDRRPGGGGGAPDTGSSENLTRLSQALQVWARQNGGVLPAVPNAAAAKTVLRNFVTGEETWIQPGTGESYAVNPWISEKKLADLDAAATVAFYEFQPDRGGGRRVVYLDGNVDRVSAEEWAKIQEAQNLP